MCCDSVYGACAWCGDRMIERTERIHQTGHGEHHIHYSVRDEDVLELFPVWDGLVEAGYQKVDFVCKSCLDKHSAKRCYNCETWIVGADNWVSDDGAYYCRGFCDESD